MPAKIRRTFTDKRKKSIRFAVRTLRGRMGWKQTNLAAALNEACGHYVTVTQSTISKWENGLTQPRAENLQALVRLAESNCQQDLIAAFRSGGKPK